MMVLKTKVFRLSTDVAQLGKRFFPKRQCARISLVLIVLFVLSFAVRVSRLSYHSLWWDEANTASLVGHKSLAESFHAIAATTTSETLHPLYYFLLSIWAQVAGDSEIALRLPSVLFGSLAVIVCAMMLGEVCGNETLHYSFLLLIAPFTMWYSREARPYALILFITGLHLLIYLRVGRTRSKRLLAGLAVTGLMSLYAGILTVMMIVAEFVWSLFVRRNRLEVLVLSLVLLLALPLAWHAVQIHFVKSSDHYSELPAGMNTVRTAAIFQELFVGRSLGPTPNEIRSLPTVQVLRNKFTELSIEALATLSIISAVVTCLLFSGKSAVLRTVNKPSASTISFVTVACIVQVIVLILLTNYRMNARHVAFLFGPLFVLAVMPIACCDSRVVKTAFLVPLLVIWTWSCANQMFDPSYGTEDYRNAAKILKSQEDKALQVIALCNPMALKYYGVEQRIVYLPASPDLTVGDLSGYLGDGATPTWVVLSRPWIYPGFNSDKLRSQFRLMRSEQLLGIEMWLLQPANRQAGRTVL